MKKLAIRTHRALAWMAVVALFMWGVSGLLHPLMSTFGVQQAVFMPPQRPLNLQGIRPIRDTLLAAGIEQASAVRVVVGVSENLLQVTETPDAPRRYFRLFNGAELPRYDAVHAVFLAQHYLGIPEARVDRVSLVTAFSDAYPAVNRLLPVYRVEFERDDGLTAYVYTETNALAAVTDHRKETVQRMFQWFHTWSWLPRQTEWVRVALMGLMCLSLLAMSVTGVVMLVRIRRPGRAPGLRAWHRAAGYALALPLLLLSFSGLFHLLQNAGDEPVRKLTLSPPLDLRQIDFAPESAWSEWTDGLQVNAFSLVLGPSGEVLYRLGTQASSARIETPKAIRNARFDGVPVTGPAVYVRAADGRAWPEGDRALAMHLGERFTGQPASAVQAARLVTRFGPGYDFRNKRLPVWQLDYGAPLNASVFVDTTTGVLADRIEDLAKPERYSFSFLHKWNFLFPLGRPVQNAVISAVVIALILSALLGATLAMRRRPAVAPRVLSQTPSQVVKLGASTDSV